jgi:MFS family permease
MLNAGIQLVWGAVLTVGLQARSVELGGGSGVGAYALISSIGAALAAVVQIVAGHLSDRRPGGDRRAFYTAGIGLAIPVLFWFYLAPDFKGLLAAFLLLQLAMNVAGGPYQAIIPDYVALERRGAASSWMAIYQSLGNALGLIIAISLRDLRLVALALAAPLLITYRVTVAHVARLPRLARETSAPLTVRGPLGWLLLSRGCTNLGFYTLLGFLLFYVRSSLRVGGAATVTATGLLFLTFTLAAVAGAALAAKPADRYDKRLVMTYANATIGLALALLAAAPGLGAAFPAAFVAGAAWGAFVTADWALASAVLPGGAMATAMGVWNVATTVPQIVAPVLTAPLVLRFDRLQAGLGPRAAIVLSLLEYGLGAVLVWRLPRV